MKGPDVFIVMLVAALVLISCDAPQAKPEANTVKNIAANLRYFHDERTGECFAAVTTIDDVAFNHVQITWVPCNPKVMELIKQ